MRNRQYKILLTLSAVTISLVATSASAQATTWSAHNGASLFQSLSLGIVMPNQDTRSQILPSGVGDSTLNRSSTLQSSTCFLSRFPASFPTVRNLSVLPLSTDSVSALGKVAGSSSAPPSSAAFVPQIAQQVGGADPVLVTQVQVDETLSEPISAARIADAPAIMAAPEYWGDILTRYLHPGADGLTRFDYAALKASESGTANLGKYIDHLASQKPSTMSPNDAIAYWANLYNALTVQVVAENYPVNSIRKIKSGYRAGPWKRKLVTVEGRELSLDNIEHDIMRPTYQTPMVHYMVNCASIGCPNLKTTPWSSANLAATQEAAARAYINSPRGTKFSNGRLQVSSIYKWFKADFGGNTAGVLAHLRQYADAELLAQLDGRKKIDKYTYDWDVNAPK